MSRIFEIVTAVTLDELAQKITNAMNAGATLHGGPFVTVVQPAKKGDPPVTVYHQAVLR